MNIYMITYMISNMQRRHRRIHGFKVPAAHVSGQEHLFERAGRCMHSLIPESV